MKKLLIKSIYTAVMCALIYICTACSEEKDPNNFGPNDVPYDETTTDRAHLEKTAADFLSYFNSRDQQSALTALSTFLNILDTYGLPDKYDQVLYPEAMAAGRAMEQALSDGDFATASRAATRLTLTLANFHGMFQDNANLGTWQFIEDRDHVDFRFWIGRTEYNLVVKGIGETWSGSYADADKTYDFEVPNQLSLSLYSGTVSPYTDYLKVEVKSDVKDGASMNIATNLKFGNLVADSTTKGTSTGITEDYKLYIDNVQTLVRTILVSSTNTIRGTNLCSSQEWMKTDSDPEQWGRMVTSATSTVMIMSSVQLKTTLNDINALVANADGYWTTASTTNPAATAAAAAAALSKAITTNMYYAGEGDKLRGILGWEAYQIYEDPAYQEWGVRPTLTLTSNGATYDFGKYFGNGQFLGIEKTFGSLLNEWKNAWVWTSK